MLYGESGKSINRLRETFPDYTLTAGGGVQNPFHLEQLQKAGADGVLVATAMHKGWISRRDIY